MRKLVCQLRLALPMVLAYRVSIRLGRPEIGIRAIAITAWLTLAVTITMQDRKSVV